MPNPNQTHYGTWQARYRDGAGQQRSRNFPSKAKAERFLREVRTDVARGTYIDPRSGSVRLSQWCEEWLAGAHNLKPKSRLLYEQALAHILPAVGQHRLDRLSPAHVDAYLAARLRAGTAPSSVHREYRTLTRALNVAVARGKLLKSPMALVASPLVPHEEMRFLTAKQLDHLADTIDKRYRVLVLVAGWGGLRWGELAGLRTEDVDVARSRVHVVQQLDPQGRVVSGPKTLRGRRWVTLPATVTVELAAQVDGLDPGFVWRAARGGPLIHSNFLGWTERKDVPGEVDRPGRGAWRRALVAAGLDLHTRPHDLRHTSAALAIKAGAHPKALQERMGHRSIQTTLDRYGHLYEGMDEALAADLDAMLIEARSTP